MLSIQYTNTEGNLVEKEINHDFDLTIIHYKDGSAWYLEFNNEITKKHYEEKAKKIGLSPQELFERSLKFAVNSGSMKQKQGGAYNG